VRREPLVKAPEDVDKIRFLMPDPQSRVRGTNFPEIMEVIGDRGLLEVGAGGGSGMVRVMGRQEAMLAYFDDRDMFDRLLEVFMEYHLAIMKEVLELGVPVLYNGWHDFAVSGGWSPRIYREAFKPAIKVSADLAHSYDAFYLYFDNGTMRPLLEDVADVGTDILSPLCPPPVADIDLGEAKRSIGDRVCLKGNIDVIYVMQQGTPQQVREAVREAIRVAAPGGGFILSNSSSFLAETPRENIEAFFTAARDFGRYPIKI
jgi:uroporphyrinogen decarboxylase